MLGYILASALAGGQTFTGPPPAFPIVLLGPGDRIVKADPNGASPVYQGTVGAGKYLLAPFGTNCRVITAPQDPPPSGSLAKTNPTLILFGDGHVLIVLGGTQVDYSAPLAVYLQYGTVTLADTDFSSAESYLHTTRALRSSGEHGRMPQIVPPHHANALSTKIVIRTKAVTTGAKGCLLTVQYFPTVSSGTAVVSNYETNECTLNRGDVYTPQGATLLSRCNQATVTYSAPVPNTPPLQIVTQPIVNTPVNPGHQLRTNRAKRKRSVTRSRRYSP